MSQATHVNSTSASVASSRRRFLTVAAAASAVGAGSLAVAAMPATDLIGTLPASQGFDDSELLQLEKQIFEQREAAEAYNDEVIRLSEIWQAELSRLDDEVFAGRSALTTMERWDIVKAMPESEEHERLAKLQRPHNARHDAMIERMFSIPAQTAGGRGAKASVILRLMADYMDIDEDEDYPLDLVRKLLIELVGGEPGEVLRNQFA